MARFWSSRDPANWRPNVCQPRRTHQGHGFSVCWRD